MPGEGCDIAKFEDEFAGCKCTDCDCRNDSCSCLKYFNCPYNSEGLLVDFNPFQNIMKPIHECNKHCNCSKECINTIVQLGICVELQIITTENRGLGLKSLGAIKKGQFVCEYAGEIISKVTAKERAEAQVATDSNYILALNEHLADSKIISTIVDPKRVGNAGRFINHSCEPNLFMVPVRIDNEIPRLALFALREILAGEELTYDYSGEILDPNETAERSSATRHTDVSTEKLIPCLCGSRLCRGFLPMDVSLYR